MRNRLIQFWLCACVTLAVGVNAIGECPLNLQRPTCGKVCKLVCEPKKLVSIGYGNECKTICVPPPSCPGCEHCACCCGEHKCEPCTCCESAAPKFQFCWRDWFTCGCATPRTVKVLTKYQLTKKICWYHWEVVNASCCDCVGGEVAVNNGTGIVEAPASHSFYKAAPENASIGDAVPLSDQDRVKLSDVLPAEDIEASGEFAANSH
jgi:hypothetical protein